MHISVLIMTQLTRIYDNDYNDNATYTGNDTIDSNTIHAHAISNANNDAHDNDDATNDNTTYSFVFSPYTLMNRFSHNL